MIGSGATMGAVDAMVTIRPAVAKNPAGMGHGAFTVLSYKLNGNMLTLTTVRNQSVNDQTHAR
jgi:hypothetical protein